MKNERNRKCVRHAKQRHVQLANRHNGNKRRGLIADLIGGTKPAGVNWNFRDVRLAAE